MNRYDTFAIAQDTRARRRARTRQRWFCAGLISLVATLALILALPFLTWFMG